MVPVQDNLFATKLGILSHSLTKRSKLRLGNKKNVKRKMLVIKIRSLQSTMST